MAPTKKSAAEESGHKDVDTLTSSAVADPHAVAFAERQRDPSRYDNPTIATPGVLDDIGDDVTGSWQAHVDPDTPSGLDPSVDNRDQVQPMLDTISRETREDPLASGALATAATNAHESDAVDVEALQAEQDAKREEQREAVAASREDVRSTTTKK